MKIEKLCFPLCTVIYLELHLFFSGTSFRSEELDVRFVTQRERLVSRKVFLTEYSFKLFERKDCTIHDQL